MYCYNPDFLYHTQTDAFGGQISNMDDFLDMYNQRMDMHGDGGIPIDDGQEEVLMNDQRVPDVPHNIREINKTPSEDSGVEMSNGAMVPRRDVGRARCERKRNGKIIRENGTTVEGVTWADTDKTHRLDDQEFTLQREKEEKHKIRPERQKILQKRYSERLLPKTQDLVGNTKVHM